MAGGATRRLIPTTGVIYFDTSALVKLLVAEPETAAMRRVMAGWPRRASSEIAVVELLRLARRHSPTLVPQAYSILAGLALVPVERGLLLRASELEPFGLRSLDAVHLATAIALMPAVQVLCTYDRRLQVAAKLAGLPILAPE